MTRTKCAKSTEAIQDLLRAGRSAAAQALAFGGRDAACCGRGGVQGFINLVFQIAVQGFIQSILFLLILHVNMIYVHNVKVTGDAINCHVNNQDK